MDFFGEPTGVFLRRPHRYRRLRFRLRMSVWQLTGSYEEREWYLLEHLVDPQRAAIDVGALYGSYAGRMAQLTQRVHCFEPFPDAAAELAWRLPASVILHRAAVSRQEGFAELRVPIRAKGSNPVANATLEESNPLANMPEVRRVTCQVVRLDDVIDEPVGFIKVDVEGHELAVFQGAERIIREHRPVILVESACFLNPSAPDDVHHHLRERGYGGVFLFNGRLLSLTQFDKAIHQRVDPMGRPVPGAVNNFILLPQ